MTDCPACENHGCDYCNWTGEVTIEEADAWLENRALYPPDPEDRP